MAQKPNKRHSCCVKNGEGSTRFPNEGAIWCCSLKLFVRIDAKCKSFAINVLGMYAISYFLARKYLCVLRLGSNRSKVKLSRSLALPLSLFFLRALPRFCSGARDQSVAAIALSQWPTVDGGATSRSTRSSRLPAGSGLISAAVAAAHCLTHVSACQLF